MSKRKDLVDNKVICIYPIFSFKIRAPLYRATKSLKSSHNIVALHVAVRILLVLSPCRQQIFFVAESRKSFYFSQQSRATKIRVVIRATFILQLATQICCAILMLVLHLKLKFSERKLKIYMQMTLKMAGYRKKKL